MINAKKINIKVIGAIFMIILIVLMFLSKTIYTYNLPVVTAVSPANGKLNKLEATTGIVDWADVEQIYSELGGKIEDVLVDEGDKVKAGEPLFKLSYNEDDVNNKLKEIEVNRSKLSVEVESLNMEIKQTEEKIATEEPDFEIIKSENQINKLKGQIKNAEEEYEKSKILYDEGAIAKSSLDNAANTIENLNHDLQNLLINYEELNNSSREKLENYQNEFKSFKQNLRLKELDIKELNIQEENYKKTLLDFSSNSVIVAPKDATVTSIPVKVGQYISSNQLIINFGVGNKFNINCNVSLDNNFISVGDNCEMINSSHTIDGVVTKITPEEHAKLVTISFNSTEVSTGETFEIEFSKESETSYTLIANGAINKDNDGYFVYEIKKRKGMLGEEFYVQRVSVYVGDSDNDNTVITKGIDFFEPIVLLSNKIFSNEETVKIENVGDFFEE